MLAGRPDTIRPSMAIEGIRRVPNTSVACANITALL